MTLFERACKVIYLLKEAGYEAHIIGGAVRDYILQRNAHDVDVTTNASPGQIKSVFGKVIEVGIQHGTVLVLMDGIPIEVSTYKGDTLEADLCARDFTINAMAMTIDHDIIDPFGGQKDLLAKKLRTVVEPKRVFAADPIRLLRAARFKIHLQLSVSEPLRKAMEACSSLIHETSIERISLEMEKLSLNNIAGRDWQWLFEQKVFQELSYIFKNHSIRDQLKSTGTSKDRTDHLTWWTLALHQCEVQIVKNGLQYYKLSNKRTKDICLIHDYAQVFLETRWSNEQLYNLGEKRLKAALNLLEYLTGTSIDNGYWVEKYHNLPIKDKKELVVSGKDLLLKYPSWHGPEIGKKMKAIEQAVVIAEIQNDKEEIYQWLEKES